jgi:hypothetical protein
MIVYKLKKNKFLILIFVLFCISYFSYDSVVDKRTREDIKFWIDDNINYKVDIITNVFQKNKNFLNRYYNDYNDEFLPETQNNILDLNLIKLNFIRTLQLEFLKNEPDGNNLLSFFIEFYEEDKLLIVDSRANIFILEDFDKKQVFEVDNVTHLKSDLPKKVDRVLDSYLFENKLFISFESREKDKCKNFMIYVTDINKEIIEFDKFFEDKSCKTILNSGRMQGYVIDGREGLLFAASAAIYDKPNTEPQDENSNFGKILFKDFKTNEVSIISKGHRLILGLLVNEDNSIIATENGPRGGDEINKIILGGNYGWPLASYGRRYDSDYEDNPLNYKQDHESNGYIEPIFTFIPSIGISEIIKIPNEFIRNWIDNYLIASLNKRALFRVKLNKDKDKLLFYEEIYIGSRIRDLKYSKRTKSILLALEDRGVLGILKSK